MLSWGEHLNTYMLLFEGKRLDPETRNSMNPGTILNQVQHGIVRGDGETEEGALPVGARRRSVGCADREDLLHFPVGGAL